MRALLLATVLGVAAACRDPDSTLVDGGPGDSGVVPFDDGGLDGGGLDGGDAGSDGGCTLERTLTIPGAQAARGVVLDGGTFVVNGVAGSYQLLRLPGADGHAVYAQWVPTGDGGPTPAVVLTSPYDGIDWTGEPVDALFAADGGCGGCLVPDTAGPGTGPDAGLIFYSYAPARTMAENTSVWTLNGVSVLYVFGRHYAGTSPFGHAQAMAAGLRFLEQRPDVDHARIGIFGGSLGGYEALTGAAFAPAGASPKVVAALFPLNDLKLWLQYLNTTLPPALGTDARRDQFAHFFEPYQRRIVKDTGGQPGEPGADFSCFGNAFYASRIRGQVLVLHDTWDMLVPVSSSKDLLSHLGARGQGLFYDHPQTADRATLPMSHLLDFEPVYPSHLTFVLAYVLRGLSTRPAVVVPYTASVMRTFLTQVRDLQRAGVDESGVPPRLLDLCDPKVAMYELQTQAVSAGTDYVAAEVNAVWGTTFTGATIAGQLQTNGLPP